MHKKYTSMIAWILSFQLISYGLGTITRTNMYPWYAMLHKSTLTPPAIVFPLVWTILYIMIAISGWSLWQHRSLPQAKWALMGYSAQMLLNWFWSPLFFYWHLIPASFYCIITITALTLITILITSTQFKLSTIMLMPYFLWLLFASYLNGVIWMLN